MRKLTPQEFFEKIAKRVDITPDEAKIIWREIAEFIADELVLCSVIQLPYVGEMRTVQRGGKYTYMPVSNKPEDKGKVEKVYVEPYLQAKFSPSTAFKDVINGRAPSHAAIMRTRNHIRDFEHEKEEIDRQQENLEKARNAFATMKAACEKRRAENAERARKFKEVHGNKRKPTKEELDKFYWDDFDEN